jgi:3-phenylpropionate/cinnamic acid dioxygenase small subunit
VTNARACRRANLNARYGDAIDTDRLEAWPDFFLDDGRSLITTAENIAQNGPLSLMYAAARAMLRDRVRALRQTNVSESQYYRHMLRHAVDGRHRDRRPARAARLHGSRG